MSSEPSAPDRTGAGAATAEAPGGDEDAAWGFASSYEPRWPASLAVLAAIALFVTLPARLIPGPRFLIPVLEAALLLPLSVAAPKRHSAERPHIRLVGIVLIALVNLANLASLGLLINELLRGGSVTNGRELITSSIQIYLTNIIVFGLWYWELDRGGPGARTHRRHRNPDFLFPQMSVPGATPQRWTPSFLDYLYVSFTNATAFSPTDTMPLTAAAKGLMMVQSLASLITVALVAARAVNILS